MKVPMPGDLVRLTGDWSIVKKGSFGVICGVVGIPQNTYVVCWNFDAYRGRYGGCEIVSASGGPAPFALPINTMKETKETMEATFRRLRGQSPMEGMETYKMNVPVWEWDGQGY